MSDEQKNETVKKEHPAAKVFGWLVTAACFLMIGWFAHQWMPKDKKGQRGRPPMPKISVTVADVKDLPFNPMERFVAHVEAVKKVDILPQIDGYITEVKFEEGATVKMGDVLFTIDPERYSAVLALRKSELAKAEAEVVQANAEVDRAQRYFNRLQKADERGITQSDKDTAETSLAAARAGVSEAKAGVMKAKANIALAEFDMKHTKVFAPITGQIGKALVHVGDYVAPSKKPMARVVQMDPIRVTFPMTDRAYITWKEGVAAKGKSLLSRQRLVLTLPNGDVYKEEGSWDFDDNEMSSDTATMMVRLSFPNPHRILIPNTFVTLSSTKVNPPHFPQVPETAILDFADGLGVWVVKPDGTAEQRMVKIHSTYKGMSAISEGLKVGEQVVDEGCHKVLPGVKLTVKNSKAESLAKPKKDEPVAAPAKK